MKGFLLLVGRDLRLALRQRAEAWLAVLFFVLTAALFPFGVGPEPNLLARIAPGIIWVVALLAVLLAHWLTTGLPLIAAAPLLAILFNMDLAGLGVLLLAMALGTPTLSLVGAVGAALTLGARRGGVLIPLLVLPLYVPALIFGVGATDAAIQGFAARPHLLLLAAVLLVMLVITPLAGAAALRQALE